MPHKNHHKIELIPPEDRPLLKQWSRAVLINGSFEEYLNKALAVAAGNTDCMPDMNDAHNLNKLAAKLIFRILEETKGSEGSSVRWADGAKITLLAIQRLKITDYDFKDKVVDELVAREYPFTRMRREAKGIEGIEEKVKERVTALKAFEKYTGVDIKDWMWKEVEDVDRGLKTICFVVDWIGIDTPFTLSFY